MIDREGEGRVVEGEGRVVEGEGRVVEGERLMEQESRIDWREEMERRMGGSDLAGHSELYTWCDFWNNRNGSLLSAFFSSSLNCGFLFH